MLERILKITHPTRRSGNIILIVATAMVALMGFGAMAVDYGVLVHDKNHLQRACDAAALAAAQELRKTGVAATDDASATAMAVATAAQNGVTVNASDITFSNNDAAITVPARLTRKLFFARVLGINTGDVAASATAGATPVSGGFTPYVAPFGITWETFNAYKDTTGVHPLTLIRQNKEFFDLDDLVLFDFGTSNSGKSSAQMQDQLLGFDTESATLNSYQTTLNASHSSQYNHSFDGVNQLLTKAAGAPWYDNGSSTDKSSGLTWYQEMQQGLTDYSDPRVIYIIVTPRTEMSSNGTYNTQLQAFVPIYIDSLTSTGQGDATSTVINARFLPAGTANGGFVPGNNGDTITGIRIIQLLS
jgi:hypothetical protein